MRRLSKLMFLSLLSCLFLISCSEDNDDLNLPKGGYDNGFFVLNEGSSAGGSVTFVDSALDSVEQHVFTAVNPNSMGLGKYLQSIFFHEDRAFIISNGSNLITVVNRYTFELIGMIDSGLDVPRYGVVENGKAYVTNQASFTTTEDDYVAVIDLNSFKVVKKVPVEGQAEFILEENDKLYVQNSAFGLGNQISVLVPGKGVTDIITVADGLNSIAIENGFLYALTASKLQKIELSTLKVTDVATSLPVGVGDLDIENNKIYYTVKNRVYSASLSSPANAQQVLSYTTTSQGVMYGFEVEDNRIYIADAGDYISDSFIQVYTLDGTLKEQIQVGIAPNGFYFND